MCVRGMESEFAVVSCDLAEKGGAMSFFLGLFVNLLALPFDDVKPLLLQTFRCCSALCWIILQHWL